LSLYGDKGQGFFIFAKISLTTSRLSCYISKILNGGFIYIAIFVLSWEDVVVYKTRFTISTYSKQRVTIQVHFVDVIDLLLVRPQPAENISLWAGL